MNHQNRARLCALALWSAAGAAHADLMPVPTHTTLDTTIEASTSDPRRFTTLHTGADLPATESADNLEARKFALAAQALALPAAAAPSLWSFVTAVQAQQRGDTFVQLESHLSLSQQVSAPTQVPLPAPLWLLVMGTLGVAGTRLGRQRHRAQAHPVTAPTLQPA
jgi:hypothetical protein